MPTRPLVAGYTWNRELVRIRAAGNAGRGYVRRILDEQPGPALAIVYICQILVSLGEIAAAVDELQSISNHHQEAP